MSGQSAGNSLRTPLSSFLGRNAKKGKGTKKFTLGRFFEERSEVLKPDLVATLQETSVGKRKASDDLQGNDTTSEVGPSTKRHKTNDEQESRADVGVQPPPEETERFNEAERLYRIVQELRAPMLVPSIESVASAYQEILQDVRSLASEMEVASGITRRYMPDNSRLDEVVKDPDTQESQELHQQAFGDDWRDTFDECNKNGTMAATPILHALVCAFLVEKIFTTNTPAHNDQAKVLTNLLLQPLGLDLDNLLRNAAYGEKRAEELGVELMNSLIPHIILFDNVNEVPEETTESLRRTMTRLCAKALGLKGSMDADSRSKVFKFINIKPQAPYKQLDPRSARPQHYYEGDPASYADAAIEYTVFPGLAVKSIDQVRYNVLTKASVELVMGASVGSDLDG